MRKIIVAITLLACALFLAHAKAIYDDVHNVYEVQHFHYEIIEADDRLIITGIKVEPCEIARIEAETPRLLIPAFNRQSIMITRYTGTQTNVQIPRRLHNIPVTGIGPYAFMDKGMINSVTIPNSVTYIGMHAFTRSGITNITIPDSVTYIEGSAFSESMSLTSITIPDSVTYIGTWAFRRCGRLAEVILSNSMSSIESEAFAYCSFTEIIIPASVRVIKNGAFYGVRLSRITIGADVALPTGGNAHAFENEFDGFYQTNGSKAGAYTFTNGVWAYVE